MDTWKEGICQVAHCCRWKIKEDIISCRITKGDVHDSKKFCSLVKEAAQSYNIDMVYADKTHDSREEALTY